MSQEFLFRRIPQFTIPNWELVKTSSRQTLEKLIEMVEFGVKDGCFYRSHSVVSSMISNNLKLKTAGTIQCFFFQPVIYIFLKQRRSAKIQGR